MVVLRHFAWDRGNVNPNSANAVASSPVCICHSVDTFGNSLVKGIENVWKGGGSEEDEGREKWRWQKLWLRQSIVRSFFCFFKDCEFIMLPPD
jgi:hypothetical protein